MAPADTDTQATTEQDLGTFGHLHCHSEYSSLDGGCQIGDIAARCKELGQKFFGLTDHGVMQGLPELQEALRAEGIKPILGCEIYLTENRHDHGRDTTTWHLTLLAETTEGYHNLCKISSFAFLEGRILTFGRPRARADWELLERYSEGIICLSGCMAGPVMGEIMGKGDLTTARRHLERLVQIFGKENVYGEIQNVGITTGIPASSELARKLGKEPLTAEQAAQMEGPHADFSDDIEPGEVPLSQTEANRELAEMCQELGLRLVATGDVHYLRPEDAQPHDAMLCIGTGQIQRGDRRFSLLPKRYHMRSEEEMREALGEWPEALTETVRIAERCNAEIEWGKKLLPRYPRPEEFKTAREYLEHLCMQGLDERYPEGHPLREEALKRLEYEIGVIDNMGYSDYFVITWDLFNEARRRNIPSGPGRGSAAGSIVAYCLGITQLCPLEYGLLFERFLNPDRVSMPDIDMDYAQAYNGGREELIEYARRKYNELAGVDTAVAQIVTFSKYKAKGALKDAARVLAEPTEEGRKEALKLGDRLSKLVPDDPGITMSKLLDPDSKESQGRYAEEGKRLRAIRERGGPEADAINLAAWLEGMVRAYSTHAAAVIIADHDLTDELPLQKLSNDKPLELQYSMGPAERIGLLKMDFLGLRNLDIIWDACEKIFHTRGVRIDPYRDIPIDDPATFETFARGESVGTFQFECLAGDTIINGERTIAELYAESERRPAFLLSLNESGDDLQPNPMLQVIRNGEKQLYRLRTRCGYELRATVEHKIRTPQGFVALGDLRAGDHVLTAPAMAPAGARIKEQAARDSSFGRIAIDEVVSIEKDRVEMTYDIAMQAPLNNYIANGLVVHNSGGMQGALREVRPTEFRDLIALVALYRPGPMAHIPTYAARKHGREPVSYLHPKLEPIQKETYGLTLYQETSMQIARELAGFTPGQADDLRKAIGKKLRDKMDALKPLFLEGCRKNGVDKEVAEALWADNEAAADYSFNKSHAACYAYLAYITGWLKTHFPQEYMAALISSVLGKKDKPAEYLREAKRLGLRVLPPDVNRSLKDFAVLPRKGCEEKAEEIRDAIAKAAEHETDKSKLIARAISEAKEQGVEFDLLFGLTALRGVGGGVVEEIKAEREANGPFRSFYDLIRRMPHLNKTVIQALVKGGALDELPGTRRAMHDATEETIARIRKEIKQREKDFLRAVREQAESDGKLSTLERRGLDGAAKAIHDAGNEDVSEEELREAIAAALCKEQLRVARAAARKELKEQASQATHVAGIADEEGAGGGSEREIVEARAQEALSSEEAVRERETLTDALAPLARKAAAAVREAEQETLGFETALAEESDPPLNAAEWDEHEKLNLERSVLGIYVSGHPLDQIREQWAWTVDKGLGQFTDADITEGVSSFAQLPHVAGVVVGARPIRIRTGTMYKLTLEDLTGSQELTVWPDDAEGREELFEVGTIISAKVRVEEDTFASQKKSEEVEESEAEGEEAVEAEADEAGRPIQLIAAAIYRWNPSVGVRKRPRAELMKLLDLDPQKDPPEEIAKALAEAEARQEAMHRKAQAQLKGNGKVAAPQNAKTNGANGNGRNGRKPGDPIVIPISEAQKRDMEWIKSLRVVLDKHSDDGGVGVRLRIRESGKMMLLPMKVKVTDDLRDDVRALLRNRAAAAEEAK